MKRIARRIRQVINEIFGWNCPQCNAKRSVFFYDKDFVNEQWVDVYKCKSCDIEGYKN